MYEAALWAYEPMGNGGPNSIFFAQISHNFVGRRPGNPRYLLEVSEFAKTFWRQEMGFGIVAQD